jgi:hypothetical protein
MNFHVRNTRLKNNTRVYCVTCKLLLNNALDGFFFTVLKKFIISSWWIAVLGEIWIAVGETRKMAKSLEQRAKFLVSPVLVYIMVHKT